MLLSCYLFHFIGFVVVVFISFFLLVFFIISLFLFCHYDTRLRYSRSFSFIIWFLFDFFAKCLSLCEMILFITFQRTFSIPLTINGLSVGVTFNTQQQQLTSCDFIYRYRYNMQIGRACAITIVYNSNNNAASDNNKSVSILDLWTNTKHTIRR